MHPQQARFGTEHGLSMRQHTKHHPNSDNNIKAQGIADIITVLAQSACIRGQRDDSLYVH